jgi:uncharacterized membrane protein YeiB
MRHPLLLAISAFVVWSGAFLTIYAVQATGCSLDWQSGNLGAWTSPLRLLLITMMVASVAAVVVILLRQLRSRLKAPVSETSSFIDGVAIYVSIAALFSTAFCFTGVVWLTLCSA